MARLNYLDGRKLMSVGDVSKSLGVSRMCIIRMEKDGVLEPAYISEQSGYRYYSPENVLRIISVLDLQNQGFRRDEIREYLKNPEIVTPLYEKLLEKQRAINSMVAQMKRRIAGENDKEVEFSEIPGATCFKMTLKSFGGKENARILIKEAVAEAVRLHLPLASDRHLVLEAEHSYKLPDRRSVPRDYSVYVPLRDENVTGPNIVKVQAFRAFGIRWFGNTDEIIDAFKIIEDDINRRGFEPGGKPKILCLGTDMLDDIDDNDRIILYIMLPIKE